MQIARQVYGIDTAENALIFFANGEPAYITKRFDVREGSSKWGTEDFATLAGKTTENAGHDFKYEYSYEQLAELLVRYIPSHKVELEKIFKLIVFNVAVAGADLPVTSKLDAVRRVHVNGLHLAAHAFFFKQGVHYQQ